MGINILRANDQVINTKECLYKCLDQIPQLRRMFDIILYNLHNQLLTTIDQSKYIIETETNSPHPTIQILNSDNVTPELLELKRKLMTSYQVLYSKCLESKKGNLNTNEPGDNSMDIISGAQTFSISAVLSSPSYKYKIQDAIARGMGISINDVDYNPRTMQFSIRVDEQGEILPNLQRSNRTIRINQLRSAAQIDRSPREQAIDSRDINQAKKNAHFMVLGSLITINDENNCKLKTRGEEIENYCLNSLLTTMSTVKTETGEKTNIIDPIMSALYITPSAQLSNTNNLRRVNHAQVNDILKLIRMQSCRARNLLFKNNRSINTFKFNLPCETSLRQEIPKVPSIVNED